jgi:Skp family chaperone for outer membrane proteins
MPPTNTDKINSLELFFHNLQTMQAVLQTDQEWQEVDFQRQIDELTKRHEKESLELKNELRQIKESLHEMDKKSENAKQRIEELTKWKETWTARGWGIVTLLLSSTLALASGLIVTLARK